jgi:hypothetical protein
MVRQIWNEENIIRDGERRAESCGGTHNFLNVGHQLVKVQEGQLGLDVRVLAQVPPRVTLLGAEALRDTEDVSETGQARLEVELGALRQVRLRAVVVEREQSRSSFDLGLDHTRGSDFEEAEGGVRVAEGLKEGGADFEDAGGCLASEHEVTSIGKEGRIAVLFQADIA